MTPETQGVDGGVAGNAEVVGPSSRRWAAAGADSALLQPTEDDGDSEGFVRFAASEVAPLLA